MTRLTEFWKKLVKPEVVAALEKRVQEAERRQQQLPKKQPDWREKVQPLQLPAEEEDELIMGLKRLWLLPFHIYEQASPLLEFCYTQLPRIESAAEAAQDHHKQRLCILFRIFVKMAMQGSSLHPRNPSALGQQVLQALTAPQPDAALDPLLDLLVDETNGDSKSGFNAIEADDPDLLVETEHDRREGYFESVWKKDHKYKIYEKKVLAHPEFRSDWAALKKRYPDVDRYRYSHGLLRRSLMNERNWRRRTTSDPDRAEIQVRKTVSERERFQLAFDFFCWKWFLWGMRDDEPLVEKLTVAVTPQGTQIFIPGYWSFDAARDVTWKKLLQLHRARGVGKQGEKLEENRKGRDQQLRRLARAVKKASQKKIRGQAKYSFLKKEAGYAPALDDAQLRRLIKDAQKLCGDPR